ncbi:MAG: M28 family peptidase [Ktedonobacteraceae bacterium]
MLHMLRRIISVGCLFMLFVSVFAVGTSITGYAHSSTKSKQLLAQADFLTVDPNYIYDQLYYMATNFQHREAGYDTHLPPKLNGHDEFANYWAQEMSRDLVGFGAQVRRDPFHVDGWQGRSATVPAFNVEVSVPGAAHAEQVVVIGCHYDGEAISTQSANDDASGCAIELGIAKAMGAYWRSHHTYPARTLRFVIFDAEEQGLYGSFHYVNTTVNGDLQNIMAMFNEEQNGIAYPLRFLGQMSNPILPFYVDMTPLVNNQLYSHQDALSQVQISRINRFRALMQQAVPAVFQQFQTMGYKTLLYHSGNTQDVSQPIFTADQQKNIQLEDDTLGSSDQVPFTLAGIACATLVGNSSYYENNPPPWSYPYDQKQDTIQLMNTFANGSTQKATALTLSLGLPAMLTTWMLNQPDILGATAANTGPIAAVSDIGQTLVGQSVALDASASYVPGNTAVPLSYAWDFGDGSTASGVTVNHTYQLPGTYTLMLTVASSASKLLVSKEITVVSQGVQYPNSYSAFQASGVPPTNPAVVLPTPTDATPGQVHTTAKTTTASNPASIVGFLLLIVVSLVIIFLVVRGTRLKKKKEDV